MENAFGKNDFPSSSKLRLTQNSTLTKKVKKPQMHSIWEIFLPKDFLSLFLDIWQVDLTIEIDFSDSSFPRWNVFLTILFPAFHLSKDYFLRYPVAKWNEKLMKKSRTICLEVKTNKCPQDFHFAWQFEKSGKWFHYWVSSSKEKQFEIRSLLELHAKGQQRFACQTFSPSFY